MRTFFFAYLSTSCALQCNDVAQFFQDQDCCSDKTRTINTSCLPSAEDRDDVNQITARWGRLVDQYAMQQCPHTHYAIPSIPRPVTDIMLPTTTFEMYTDQNQTVPLVFDFTLIAQGLLNEPSRVFNALANITLPFAHMGVVPSMTVTEAVAFYYVYFWHTLQGACGMMHMMGTSVVEFLTPESAIVQTAVIAKHDVRGNAGKTFHPVTGQLQMVSNDEISGYYVFDVVKTNSKWYISAFRLFFTMEKTYA